MPKIQVSGEWKGISAAGSLEAENWRLNPQFELFLTVGTKAQVDICLDQINSTHSVAVFVFRGDGSGVHQVALSREDLLIKSSFLSRKTMMVSLNLEGKNEPYVLLPCCSEPGQQGNFNISVNAPHLQKFDQLPFSWSHLKSIKSSWTAVSAGGCANHASFANNPQFLFRHSSAAPISLTTIVHQPSAAVSADVALGVYLIQLAASPTSLSSSTMETLNNNERLKTIDITKIITKGEFTSSFDSSFSATVKPNVTYLVIPCTFDPSASIPFSLSFFAPFSSSLNDDLFEIHELGAVESVSLKGEWKGRTAGGCLNHATWIENVQYLLQVEAPLAEYTITLELLSDQTIPIGWYLTSGNKQITKLEPSKVLVKGKFGEEKCISEVARLKGPASYVIIPCAYEAGDEGHFSISVSGGSPKPKLTSLEEKLHEVSIRGCWKGVSAGGCANHSTWKNNPMFSLSTNGKVGKVNITLQQKVQGDEDLDDFKSIGFYVQKGSSDFFDLRKNQLAKAQFTNFSYVSVEVDLPSLDEPFILIPCSFYPGLEGEFELKVSSSSLQLDDLVLKSWSIRDRWKYFTCSGHWLDSSAGGRFQCPTWEKNPTISFSLSHSSSLVVFLGQDSLFLQELYAIGFNIVRDDLSITRESYEKKLVYSSSIIRTVEVKSDILKLEPGVYTIVPFTFNAECEAIFNVQIYSTSSVLPLKVPPSSLYEDEVYNPQNRTSRKKPATVRAFSTSMQPATSRSSKPRTAKSPSKKDSSSSSSEASPPSPGIGSSSSADEPKKSSLHRKSVKEHSLSSSEPSKPPLSSSVSSAAILSSSTQTPVSASPSPLSLSTSSGESVDDHDLNTKKLPRLTIEKKEISTRSLDSVVDKEKEDKRKSSTVRERSPRSPRERERAKIEKPPSMRRGLTLSESDLKPTLPQEQEKKPKRTLIAQELLATEENYIGSLSLLYESYYQPFQKRIGELLSQNQFSRIFTNLPVIIQCNGMLRDELKNRIEPKDSSWDVETSVLADVFIKLSQSFLIYSDFVNGYNEAVNELKHLTSNPPFSVFVQECDKSTNKLLRIQDYLIMPVQRIPRYVLLLQELFKHTPEGHPDHENTQTAIMKMRRIATQINDKKKEAENRAKLLSLSTKLTGKLDFELIQPERRFIYESKLDWVQSKANKKDTVHVFLFNNLVLVTKEEKAQLTKKVTYKFLEKIHIDWNTLHVLPSNTVDHEFLIGSTYGNFLFHAEDSNQRDAWIIEFNSLRHDVQVSRL